MRQHAKQAALPFALMVPLVLALVFSAPFTAATSAQGGGMVGPQSPILLDSNRDGRPSPGDTPINPQQAGFATLQLPPNFSCGTQPNNTVTLGSPEGMRFRSATRMNNAREQVVTITSSGTASQFSFTERAGSTMRAQGTGRVLDTNGDGVGDAFSISGTTGSALLSLVFTPGSSHVSIPVSQAVLLGARQGRCGPSFAQVWVPLADTNGDGRGDTIIFDLDGNGMPDPQYFTSPPLGGMGVPTTNSIGLALLTLLLGAVGVWYLGPRRIDGIGTV